MIVETALKIAGPGSVLAARPAGVAHVVPAGPLTPGGGFIPRARRPVCRARTRRLRVLTMPPAWSSLSPQVFLPRLCARCSTCLSRRRTIPPGVGTPLRRVEQHPVTRGDWARRYADMTPLDVWAAVTFADTPAELDTAAHASLALFGHAGCIRGLALPGGRLVGTLHQTIAARRRDLAPNLWLVDQAAAHEAHATAIRKGRAEDARARRNALLTSPTRTGAPL